MPGYEAPVNLAYSATNRSASVRIPYVASDKVAASSSAAQTALVAHTSPLAPLLMAMIDGIQNQIDPGEAMDKNIYDLPPEELATIPSTCRTLEEALDELEADKDWLTAGDVFVPDLLEAYIEYKRDEEVEPLKLRPNPYEFSLYYDA